jgi:hypothetical protein
MQALPEEGGVFSIGVSATPIEFGYIVVVFK